MTLNDLITIDKECIPEAAESLASNELPRLVALLDEKDDKLRYSAFLLLQSRSECADDVYPFFNTFADKLKSDNSYQRSIGLMLMARNAKWDTLGKLEDAIDDYLNGVSDEKPITVRQCIQALMHIIPYKKNLHKKIAQMLMSIDIAALRPTMRKLVLMDILQVLMQIRQYEPSCDIDTYIFDALSGGILDDKSKKQIQKAL
jgi:hypothetical protein